MPRRLIDGVQNGESANPALLEILDEPPAPSLEVLLYSCGHQLSDDSSIA